MRNPFGAFIIIAVMLLLDSYVFVAIKTISASASLHTKTIIYSIYWTISILAIFGFLIFVFTSSKFLPANVRTYLFATVLGLFMGKIIAVVFFMADDIRRSLQWIVGKLFYSNSEGAQLIDEKISRSVFLSWLGLAAGGSLFGTLLYGFSNKYNYQVRKVKLSFPNLPESFKGLKVVHFSDVHSGSFTNKRAVMHGVEKMMAQNADVIIFSGDLVNNEATEMKDYMDVFSQVKAPLGVYSTFGNHDYGDYVTWPIDGISKEQNLKDLAEIHASLGWKLLMNEHVVLKKNEDEIAIIGVENWSNKARFPKHGNLKKAHAGAGKYSFKILVSHDPSHWDAQVRPGFSDIDLMLAGHTHGMQFGIDIPGFKWSPVQYMYEEWAGLYENGKQKLYVNRGFGFIGYPGRVGILPEITVLQFT
ncbi:MAG: metallophosphoesterase [Ginsengibacter sp.]